MCGILAILGITEPRGAEGFRRTALQLAKRLRHRGPDWSGIYAKGDVVIAHERLAIVDVASGAQPLYSEDSTIVLAVNGEIYNHRDLRAALPPDTKFASDSDCAPVLHLFENSGFDKAGKVLNSLQGMFAFVIYNAREKRYIAARDPIGIIPLYIGYGKDGSVWFASEAKALADHCAQFMQFPPGHFYDSASDTKIKRYYTPPWLDLKYLPSSPLDLSRLRQALVKSVESHLMADVPYGVLLSGGLDSSLISSIACRLIAEQTRSPRPDDKKIQWWSSRLPSFSIGLEGSPDLAAAQKVSDYLGTIHHSYTFSIQEGLDAVPDVIYHLETFDVTTVRASTPMYLMARKIKAQGVKMVLSGEGADELFGGYLYFHKAPNPQEFHQECVRKVQNLHMYDCLRANKAMSAFGVETRVPFLDKDFLKEAMDLDPVHKMCKDEKSGAKRCEKHVLRAAFDCPEDPYLPKELLWRQKEQFSDGVGYGWIDALRDYAEAHVTDAQMETAQFRFPSNTPASKEAYLYRQIFEGHFPQPCAVHTVPGGPSIACSTAAAIAWDESFAASADPSGRAVQVHNEAY